MRSHGVIPAHKMNTIVLESERGANPSSAVVISVQFLLKGIRCYSPPHHKVPRKSMRKIFVPAMQGRPSALMSRPRQAIALDCRTQVVSRKCDCTGSRGHSRTLCK